MAALPGVAVRIACKSANAHAERFGTAAAHRVVTKEMTQMKKLMMFAFVASFAVGCSKKSPSCEDVYKHTLEIAPAEMKPMLEQGKDKALEKCSKLPEASKRCAMDAKTVQDLQKCPRE